MTGPDVSMYQPGVNFAAVRAAGEAFAIVKFTEGVGYLDPWAERHRNAVMASGLPWAPYHFARPANNPVTEADWFVNQALRLSGWTLPPVCDFETKASGSWLLAFNQRVAQRIGRPTSGATAPIAYTGAYVMTTAPAELAGFPLWIAAYMAGYAPDPNPATIPLPPPAAPWGRNWSLWQFTSSASIPGVPGRCDRSVATSAWIAAALGPTPPEDDMPYTPDQLDQIVRGAVLGALEFIARDARDGKVYWFSKASMTKRYLPSSDVVRSVRQYQGVPFLRGDDPNANQDLDGATVDTFATLTDPVAIAGPTGSGVVTLSNDQLDAIARRVADEQARRLAS